ncbi:hypothetical protein D3C80_1752090 [compost metagenome]
MLWVIGSHGFTFCIHCGSSSSGKVPALEVSWKIISTIARKRPGLSSQVTSAWTITVKVKLTIRVNR